MSELKVLEEQLLSADSDITKKYRALFTLRNIATPEATLVLEKCLLDRENDEGDRSALLKHEVAYALGQIGLASSLQTLENVLSDTSVHSMVRHEAGEAIGALNLPESLPILKKFANDQVREVAETCQLAIDRVNYYQQQLQKQKDDKNEQDDTSTASTMKHKSVDPAPPLALNSVAELSAVLKDQETPLFERYRAMFALREEGSAAAVQALCDLFDDESALLKHEVAFVLGQMARGEAIDTLVRVLKDKNENIMVRHEAAEALGACAGETLAAVMRGEAATGDGDATLKLLAEHADDDAEDVVVVQSVAVALDVAQYTASTDFQYCETNESLAQQQ